MAAMNVPRPTIVANAYFNPDVACEQLHKAMKGFGTNEDALMQAIISHNNAQRQQIRQRYTALYGKDLIAAVKGETSGNFEKVLDALLKPLAAYEAECLKNAIKGFGTNESTLIEVLVGKSNYQISLLKQEFEKLTGKPLDTAIKNDLSGYFEKVARSLCSGARNESWGSPEQADIDAQALVKAGIAQMGTDESVFNQILCSRSYPHLMMVFNRYVQVAGEDIVDSIKKEFSGDVQKILLAIVSVVRSPPVFFAERLHHAMKDTGTKDDALIRILVTRSEIDLADIKSSYLTVYGQPLSHNIEKETSGEYKKALLMILGERI